MEKYTKTIDIYYLNWYYIEKISFEYLQRSDIMKTKKDLLILAMIGLVPWVILFIVLSMNKLEEYNIRTFNVNYYIFYLHLAIVVIGCILASTSFMLKKVINNKICPILIVFNLIFLIIYHFKKVLQGNMFRTYTILILIGVYFVYLIVYIFNFIKIRRQIS